MVSHIDVRPRDDDPYAFLSAKVHPTEGQRIDRAQHRAATGGPDADATEVGPGTIEVWIYIERTIIL